MSLDAGVTIYFVTSLTEQELGGVISRFEGAGFPVVVDQAAVMAAIEHLIPGVPKSEAWITLTGGKLQENTELLKASGRLIGLRSVDPDLIVFPVTVTEESSYGWLKPIDGSSVPYNQLEEMVGPAISFISQKLAARSARSAEKKEVLENVDKSLEKHITPILESLSRQEKYLRWAAFGFYAAALVTLVSGLLFAIVRAHQFHVSPPRSWVDIAGAAVSGIIVIGMLTAVARLSFILGRSFMVESLTNGDRAHAITFGRFYLQAFGDKAEWSEVKEAFQNWNTDRGSSFMAQAAADIDPMVLQIASEALKSVGKSK